MRTHVLNQAQEKEAQIKSLEEALLDVAKQKQKVAEELEKAKDVYEKCKETLGPEIERLRKLSENAEKEFERKASEMAKNRIHTSIRSRCRNSWIRCLYLPTKLH